MDLVTYSAFPEMPHSNDIAILTMHIFKNVAISTIHEIIQTLGFGKEFIEQLFQVINIPRRVPFNFTTLVDIIESEMKKYINEVYNRYAKENAGYFNKAFTIKRVTLFDIIYYSLQPDLVDKIRENEQFEISKLMKYAGPIGLMNPMQNYRNFLKYRRDSDWCGYSPFRPVYNISSGQLIHQANQAVYYQRWDHVQQMLDVLIDKREKHRWNSNPMSYRSLCSRQIFIDAVQQKRFNILVDLFKLYDLGISNTYIGNKANVKTTIYEKLAIKSAKNGEMDMIEFIFPYLKSSELVMPAVIALESGHLDITEFFLAKGMNNYNIILLAAAQHGHMELVQRMIHLGAEIERDSIATAFQAGHHDIVKYLFELSEFISDDIAKMFGCMEAAAFKKLVAN